MTRKPAARMYRKCETCGLSFLSLVKHVGDECPKCIMNRPIQSAKQVDFSDVRDDDKIRVTIMVPMPAYATGGMPFDVARLFEPGRTYTGIAEKEADDIETDITYLTVNDGAEYKPEFSSTMASHLMIDRLTV